VFGFDGDHADTGAAAVVAVVDHLIGAVVVHRPSRRGSALRPLTRAIK
jgi:hypothetical protein